MVGLRVTQTYGGTVGYFARLGFPAPEAMVWLAMVVMLSGGGLLVAGWKTQWASWMLLAYVVIATAMAHRFWEFDATQYANQLNHFLKNLAIIGALLQLAVFGGGALSVDARRRRPAPGAG